MIDRKIRVIRVMRKKRKRFVREKQNKNIDIHNKIEFTNFIVREPYSVI